MREAVKTKKWKSRFRLWPVLLGFLLVFQTAGCGSKDPYPKVQDLEFTVVEEEDYPRELANAISQKKESAFRLTYSDGENLYIAVGYGKQPTGGYSIQISQVYLSEDVVVVDSNLMGPEGEGAGAASYPYLVIKTGFREEPVVFL